MLDVREVVIGVHRSCPNQPKMWTVLELPCVLFGGAPNEILRLVVWAAERLDDERVMCFVRPLKPGEQVPMSQ